MIIIKRFTKKSNFGIKYSIRSWFIVRLTKPKKIVCQNRQSLMNENCCLIISEDSKIKTSDPGDPNKINVNDADNIFRKENKYILNKLFYKNAVF